MDSRLKEIVNECRIKERKEQMYRNKEDMLKLSRVMSNLTLNRDAAMYAFNLDLYYLLQNDEKESKEELELLANKLLELEKIDSVLEYKKAREQYEILGYSKDDYYRSINIDLRNAIMSYMDPMIYIKQSKCFRNIVSKEDIYNEEGTILYPFYDMESNRNYRFFYNKSSFLYLKELSEDYSFDLEGKDIGKVLIKKY